MRQSNRPDPTPTLTLPLMGRGRSRLPLKGKGWIAAPSAWVAAHPLFLCGFRPFFLAAGSYAVLLMAAWSAMLAGVLPVPDLPGGALAWHAHELIHGFALAASAGFLLTAVPEFTGSPGVDGRRLRQLSLLWLSGRIAYGLSGLITVWPAAALDLGFYLWLFALCAPPIWRDPGRPQLSFVLALLALTAVEAGFFIAADPMAWLHLATGVLMILIVIAQSRISMRLINTMLAGEGVVDVGYLARPPRRNLAMFAIGLHTGVEFLLPGNPVTGWLALAAAAALFNLMGDWHIGRHLFNRWVFMLYAVYGLMAAGYGLIGLALLADWALVSAGRHLLLAGAMSLVILVVMAIAGRIHAGFPLDRRPWLPLAAGLIVLAAGLRALAALVPAGGLTLAGAALAWLVAFGLYLVYFMPVLLGPRPDAAHGCAEPAGAGEGGC